MIEWLCAGFGFTVKLKVEGDGGSIVHSERGCGEGLVTLGGECRDAVVRFGTPHQRPLAAGGDTQNLMVCGEDVDAHCAHARATRARIAAEPELHDCGDDFRADRSHASQDPEGHAR